LSEGDPALLNFYGSILVNPAKWPKVKFKEAKIFTGGLHRGPVLMRSSHTASPTRNFSFCRVHNCDPNAITSFYRESWASVEAQLARHYAPLK